MAVAVAGPRSLLPGRRPPQGWLRRRATVADRALLAVLGTARTHQQSFALFLGLVLGMAVLTVVVFVAPRPPERS